MKQAMASGARRMTMPISRMVTSKMPWIASCSRLRGGRVDQQQADPEDKREEHHGEDVVGGRGGEDVARDDVEQRVDARGLLAGRARRSPPAPWRARRAWLLRARGRRRRRARSRLATASAISTAIADSRTVKTRVLMPTRFSERMSPISAMPMTSAEKSSGMTSMNSSRRKIWPIGSGHILGYRSAPRARRAGSCRRRGRRRGRSGSRSASSSAARPAASRSIPSWLPLLSCPRIGRAGAEKSTCFAPAAERRPIC